MAKFIDGLAGSQWEDCHIILNTHGASGCSDLQDEVIKKLIQKLSEYDIAVSKITALMCNGFKVNVPTEEDMESSYRSSSFYRASMQILQSKLAALTTKIPQCFPIRGLDEPYDTVLDRDMVINLLKGEYGKELCVVTKPEIKKRVDYESIRNAVKVCGLGIKGAEYDKAGNVLAKVLVEMKNSVKHFFMKGGELNKEYHSFYDAVLSHDNFIEKPKFLDFSDAYEKWIKEVGLSNPLRLKVFSDYCDAMDPPIVAATGGLCLSPDSPLDKTESIERPLVSFEKHGLFSTGSIPSDTNGSLIPSDLDHLSHAP